MMEGKIVWERKGRRRTRKKFWESERKWEKLIKYEICMWTVIVAWHCLQMLPISIVALVYISQWKSVLTSLLPILAKSGFYITQREYPIILELVEEYVPSENIISLLWQVPQTKLFSKFCPRANMWIYIIIITIDL